MYKALRSSVPEVVRFSVHDVARLHTGSLHSCYQMPLPYRRPPPARGTRMSARTCGRMTPSCRCSPVTTTVSCREAALGSTTSFHGCYRILLPNRIVDRQAIKRGVFMSVKNLNKKIRKFTEAWNKRKHPFLWTKTADQVLENVKPKPTSETRR